uniref:uncharacterized protein LOC120337578 isoform X3 n=1 Tax=Styela clava TaxID=7725 RepID=UPI0019393510|nr:uncharacterized protein LOC120337578 isoform X3 [Styela clava]
MSETSIGSDDRIQCLAIVLHRCVGDNERSVEELANALWNKEITNKVEDKLIFDSIAEKDYGKALNQMVKSVANAEGGIEKFPTYLRESGIKDQVVTLVEKVVAADPHNALMVMVKSWNKISSREENFKREIQNTWPDKVESLTRDWPIRFMIFCSDGITEDGANRLLSSTSDDEGAQIPAGGEVNPALMSGDTSGNHTENFEEPPVPDESNQLDSFVVIDEDDLKPRGDLSTPTSTEYAPKASEYNSETEVDNLTEQKEYCQDDFEDPDHEPDFLIERYDEIETSRDILLPIVMIIWPEINIDESWPADLISIASEDGNEQVRDQLIKIIQYIFQKKKDMCDFEPLPYLDMGAAEQWIHNFEKYFNQSDEQVHVMKMLLEISWTELINIQPDMWKNELVKKYQSDPCRATNFINASKILFGLIQEKIVDNPSHPSGESNEYSASEMSVDLSSIVGMLSESANPEDLSDFVTNNYDTLESLRILLLPMIEFIWPGDSELINEESWLEEMMSRETNTENQLFHHQFIKICCCLFELRKASPMIQPSLIAEPQRAWDWMQEAFQKFTKSQNALLILSFFIKIRWPSFESTEPGEWMNFLQKQDSPDQEGFLVFANATKILLDLLQACEIEKTGEAEKDPNFRPEEAFLKNKYEEILVARDILAPIIKLIWPKDTRLAEGDNWLNELVAVVSNAENRTPGQHFIQACQCVIDLIKEAAEFQAPQIMDAKAARAWMLANSRKMINLSEPTAELDMIFQLAWPNIEKIQRTKWTKIFLRQYKLDITTATNFANAARIILELIKVTKRDGTNEQTLWKKEELSPELEFFIDNYEALHDSDVLLLPIACLVWSGDLIKFKENDDWLDELIARIASEEDESSVQNFIELSRQVMDLKKEISDMTLIQTHTIDLNEARAWIINHPRIFKKTEQMAMVFNRLLCIGWPQTETTHDMDIIVRIWTQILLEKHKSDTSRVTEFVNAADVFLQLQKVSEKVDESEEEEFQELASFLNENFDEISASREILLPTMKFTWPVLFNAETVNNWPDEIIASIFENEDIDRSKPFMKLCYWILNIKKQAPEFKVPQIYETMDVPIIRKWIIQKTKIFRKSETRIELFNALLALGALNLESCIPETWLKSLLKKVKTEAARFNELIYNADLILKLIEVEESLTAKAEKSHTPGQTPQTPGTPTQPSPMKQNASRTQKEPKTRGTPQIPETSTQPPPIKQNASRTQGSIETLPITKGSNTPHKPAKNVSPSPTPLRRSDRIRTQRHSSENGSIDTTSHAGQDLSNSRYQQDSATQSTSVGTAETEQRSSRELWQPSVRSTAMDIREKQFESGQIIIRVAVSGVQPDEKVCIMVGRNLWMMEHLENGVYTITLPWENAIIYWFTVYNSKTCQNVNETISGARSVYSYNSESYVFDVAYFHKAEPTISPRYWGELLSKFLPTSGNDIFTSTILKSELIGWVNQITGGWNIAGQKKYVNKQTYENCLIGWLQILKNEEKLMGTLALMIAMNKLKCNPGDDLMKYIVEGLHLNLFGTDKQRQLHQLIATIFLDKYLSPENLSEMIIELLQSCYLTNPKWLLVLPLCHFIKQDRHSLSNEKPDEARQSAFFLNLVSENVMKSFPLPKKYSTSNYQDCLVELAPQIQEIQNSHPWIIHLYQNTLTTDSVGKLLKGNTDILKSFRLDKLLMENVKLIEKRLKSSAKDKALTIIEQSEKLFDEIFHYAKIKEFDRKFTDDKIEECVVIMMAMLAFLSASLKKFDSNHKIYFLSKIASLITHWSTMLLAANEKFTDDSTSHLVLDFQIYVQQKVATQPGIKKNLQFFDNLLRIEWPEKYRTQWVELIQVEINTKIDEKWENADEKYFKFFTQTILEGNFCDELEHCFSEKALDIAAGVLNEDQDYEPYFCGLSAIFSSQKNTSVTKFIEKLFNKEIKTRGIDEKTSTKNILKFICEWPISLSIFKFIYSNNALEISPSAKHTINMIKRRCKEFLDTLQKGNVLRDDLNVVREYHSKLCQFLQTMFPKIVGTGTKTLEINIGKMQAKLEQFIKELNNYKTFCKMCSLIKERHVNYSKLKEVYERSVQSKRLDGLFTIEDVKTNPGSYSGLTEQK